MRHSIRPAPAIPLRVTFTTVLSCLALASGALVLTTAPPAAASPADCQNWRAADAATDKWTVTSTPLTTGYTLPYNRRQVDLRAGNINGVQHGWTRIVGYTKAGDKYWMDVSRDGGRSWIQCGPFTLTRDGESPWTPAHAASPDPNLRFRACGRAADEGQSACGPWW
ncbi:hypothetical protein ACWDX6_21390 [Streptomyces sp. NPDC003027]